MSLDCLNTFHPEKHILVNDRILLKIETIPEKIGVIILSDEIRLKKQNAVIKGELISWSKDAFRDFHDKPEKGDTIYFETYAGRLLYTEDGTKRYRHMSIKDITGFEKKE